MVAGQDIEIVAVFGQQDDDLLLATSRAAVAGHVGGGIHGGEIP